MPDGTSSRDEDAGDARAGHHTSDAEAALLPPAIDWRATGLVVAFSAAIQAAAWAVLYVLFGVVRIAYDFFDISDIANRYHTYALYMAQGLAPYKDFFIEYPPLFVPLLLAAGDPAGEANFMYRFAALMVLFMIATGVTTAIASIEDAHPLRPYAVAAVFSVLTVALGPISANRYDAVVAFVLALTLRFMMRGTWEAAGIALGLGFALKITPAMLLPVVLILAPSGRAVRALAGFAVAAVIPFAWVLASGGQSGLSLWEMIGYHLSRPLEIESVLATPLWIARLAGAITVKVANTAGSQVIQSPTADIVATLSAVALLVALGATYWLVWRRRARVAANPRLIALAALATILASLVGSKVLSPQYFVWTLPAVALVALDRRVLGGLLGGALLLTQILFPANYWAFALSQVPGTIAIVIARNLLLVAAFGLSLWELSRVPRT